MTSKQSYGTNSAVLAVHLVSLFVALCVPVCEGGCDVAHGMTGRLVPRTIVRLLGSSLHLSSQVDS